MQKIYMFQAMKIMSTYKYLLKSYVMGESPGGTCMFYTNYKANVLNVRYSKV